MKDNIDNWVEDILEGKMESFHKLDNEVRSATSTMTSIPKPFKFLADHYKSLEGYYKKYDGEDKVDYFFDFFPLEKNG